MAQDTVALSSIQSAIARAIRLDSDAYTRIEKAATLIALGAVTKVADLEYTVLSQTRGNGRYVVTPGACTCQDAERHPGQRCKHQWSVRILLSAEKTEQKAREAAVPVAAGQIREVVAQAMQSLAVQYPHLTLSELDRLSAFKRKYNAPAVGV